MPVLAMAAILPRAPTPQIVENSKFKPERIHLSVILQWRIDSLVENRSAYTF
jgi:hypothetical protein